MSTVKYKDYQAIVEYDNGSLFVKVLHIDDLLIGECATAAEAEAALKELIDEYLADCAEAGREPSKPFKGNFNVRISPEMHRRAAMTAADQRQSLNSWVAAAISEKLECGRLADRLDGVISERSEEITLAAFWQSAKKRTENDFNHLRRPRFYNEEQTAAVTMLSSVRMSRRKLHG
jgi:predicted HicB family RNase H-like nuclease